MKKKPSKKKVYESLDEISQEMAKRYIKENKHKFSHIYNQDFLGLQNEEDDKNMFGRNAQKKWTTNNNISSLQSFKHRKNDKLSSLKTDIINNIFSDKNKEDKKFSPYMNQNENNVLNLQSEENSSKSLSSDDIININDNINNENEKDIMNNSNNNQNDNKIKNLKLVSKEISKKAFNPYPKRRSIEPKLHFSRKNKTFVQNNLDDESISSRNKSNEKDKDKIYSSEKSDSNNFIKQLSKSYKEPIKRKLKYNTLIMKQHQHRLSTNDVIITPLRDEDEKELLSENKPKNVIKLQKICIRNMTIYKPMWTPKQFYEHEIFLQKRKERINNSKKIKQILKNNENYQSIPNINPLPSEFIPPKNKYIPIIERSIDDRNRRLSRNIINEKLKEKQIDEMMKKNKTFNLDKTEYDLLYWRQKLWQKKVENKLNKSSYKIQKLKEKEQENNFKNYKLQLCPGSKKMIEEKMKYFNTITTNNNIKTRRNNNVFEKLYQDSKSHEKKINNLTRSYFNTLFIPNIIHTYINNRKIINKKKSSSCFNIKNYNKKRKINNIAKKNKKKNFSLFFGDITMHKNKSRNKKSKNEIMTSIDSTKTSKKTSNTRQQLSSETDNIKNIKSKIIPSISKEISPIPLKLGEIKEADSNLSESTRRKNKQENKNSLEINKVNDNINNTNNSNNKNNLSQNKSANSNDNIQLISKGLIKKKEENRKNNNNEHIFSLDKKDSTHSNNTNNINNTNNTNSINNMNNNNNNNLQLLRKSSSSVRPSNFKMLLKENELMKNNQNIRSPQKKTTKHELFFEHHSDEINNTNNNNHKFNHNNSHSFNSLIKKEESKNNKYTTNNNIIDNNDSEYFLKQSGSFINYNNSNLISKEYSSKKIQKIEIKKQKSKKIEKKNTKNKKINFVDVPANSIKKIETFNFDAYENKKSEDSISSEETSSIKENDDIIQKIRNIEMKEEHNKIDKIIEGKKNKNENLNSNESDDEIGVYMLNLRTNVANAIQQPFIYTDNKGIFFNFFKKN